jgi:hypothetical protein
VRRFFDIAALVSLITLLISVVLAFATHCVPRSSTRALSPSIERTTVFAQDRFRITQITTLSTPNGISRSFETIIEIEFWPVAFCASILPLVWISSARSGGRNPWRGRHWLCQKCGYDLRGSPERCPECGTPAVNPWLQNRRERS